MAFYYPENLPITERKEEILSMICSNQVTIIAGETGSGKTTQLPKMCLEALPNDSGRIGCTQPRRIAALTVSARVAEELGDSGRIVGSKIRFQDKTSDMTRIKFMTDGILLAEIKSDILLKEYDVLIIDEAHERSLNIDFLLGYLKKILLRRPQLKLIITSATIDTEAFSKHFDNAPVVIIPGKTYPIETRYTPPDLDEYGEPESYIDACAGAALDVHMNEPPGDILIFLPTERDILNCSKLLRKKNHDAEVLPLYGRLHPSDQKRIFQPTKKTKIVVATNVAETSITVPGIRYVIDTGLARMSYYNYRAKTNSLPIRKISQASCNQRRGRCGRIGPGVCIRLFEEEDIVQRDEFTTPEIQRSNLAEVILQMISFKLGEPATFPFIDPPHPSAIREGYRLLHELGALDEKRNLTLFGRIMARLPIDPCIARIIIEADKNRCLKEIMVIAAVLAIQDPRVRPLGMEKKADEVHQVFAHSKSDFLTLLNIWQLFHKVKGKTFLSRLKKFCKSHFLSFQRMREWIDLHEQMFGIVNNKCKFTTNTDEASYEAIHKSLAVGFLRNIAQKKDNKLYQGPSNKELMIFPGSGQFTTGIKWILAASLLETNRLYALTVAEIKPEWLEPIAGRLCSYSWSEPRYHKKSGQVVASEKVSLFGLVLIPSRRVNFGKTTPKNQHEARGIFIQKALVEGELIGNYPFLKQNLQLLKKWEEVEHRLRNRSILANDQVIHQFYDNALADWVYDRSSLKKFLRNRKNTGFLLLDESTILERRPENHELADFPPVLNIGSHSFNLHYVFDPASELDGVTITLPYEFLSSLPAAYFEWLVPGLVREKITYLLKSLPKKIRKHLVPINASVDRIFDDMVMYKGSLYRAIEASIFKQNKITIKRSDWHTDLPQHLRMRFRIIDISGNEIGAGRNLQALLKSEQPTLTATKESAGPEDGKRIDWWESRTFTDWKFSELPKCIPLYSRSKEIAGYLYPAIHAAPENDGVSVSFITDREQAHAQTVIGFRHHVRRKFPSQFKPLKKFCRTTLSGPSSLWLAQMFPSKAEAVDAIIDHVTDTLFSSLYDDLLDQTAYNDRISAAAQENLYTQGVEIVDNIMSILRQRREVLSEIERYKTLSQKTKCYDHERYEEYHNLLDEILPAGFLDAPASTSLNDKGRYLRSLAIRITRADSDYNKDAKKADLLRPFTSQLKTIKMKSGELSESCLMKIGDFEEMVQEYRISLFSPEIKTKIPVSPKKLQKAWQEIQNEC